MVKELRSSNLEETMTNFRLVLVFRIVHNQIAVLSSKLCIDDALTLPLETVMYRANTEECRTTSPAL